MRCEVEIGVGGVELFEEAAGDFGERDGDNEAGAAGAGGFERIDGCGDGGIRQEHGKGIDGGVVFFCDLAEGEGGVGEVGEEERRNFGFRNGIRRCRRWAFGWWM